MIRRPGPRTRGQALVEFALVFPLFLLLLFSLIVFGLYVFYNQQLANAAREAARFAAVHSATSQCPVVSHLDPILTVRRDGYTRACDAPQNGWPNMTAAARSKVWGMASTAVSITACWSGYVDAGNNYDALPTSANTFTDCTMRDPSNPVAVSPHLNPSQLSCPATTVGSGTIPPKADGDDKASSMAVSAGSTGGGTQYPTTVTVYACFNWKPPLAGVGFGVPWGTWSIGMPQTIPLKAVITEAVQRQ